MHHVESPTNLSLSLDWTLVIYHCGFFPPCFLSYIFHNPEAHWWTRLEFSWHRIFDLDGFLANYLLVVYVYVCAWMCLCVCLSVYLCVFIFVYVNLFAKISQAIRGLFVCEPYCAVVTIDCTDGLTHNRSISAGSAIMSCVWTSCLLKVVCAGVIFSPPLFVAFYILNQGGLQRYIWNLFFCFIMASILALSTCIHLHR